MKISYPIQMREAAKAAGKGLVTIDLPGVTYQTPATEKQIDDLHEVMKRWWHEQAETQNAKA